MDPPYAGPALDMMLSNYPDTFTLVQIYIDCSYTIPWGEDRYAFYSVAETPTAIFDGVDERAGTLWDVNDQYDWYEEAYLGQRGVSTDVAIGLSARQVSGPTYRVGAWVCVEPGGVGKTMRIHMVQVLDNWPEYPEWTRHGLKQAAGAEDIALSPGECGTVLRNITFDPNSWANQSDIKMIAWAQEPQASSPPGDRAEVYQAAVMGWPFVRDCNGNGIPDDEDIAGGTSQDVNVNGIPDECEEDPCIVQERGDCNGDGSINGLDIDRFIEALVDPDQFDLSYDPLMWECVGDVNCDGSMNGLDIDAFISCLLGGCPACP